MGVMVQEPVKAGDAIPLSVVAKGASESEEPEIFVLAADSSPAWESTVESDHVSVESDPKPDDAESGSVGSEGSDGTSVESGEDITAGPAVSLVVQEIILGTELPLSLSLLKYSFRVWVSAARVEDSHCSNFEPVSREETGKPGATGTSLSASFITEACGTTFKVLVSLLYS